jgi:antitoxin component of RelBE/YafQ-DinJ toxin-antitoxin module
MDEMVRINVRVTEDDKTGFKKICKDNGITMAEALRRYAKYLIDHHDFPECFYKEFGSEKAEKE